METLKPHITELTDAELIAHFLGSDERAFSTFFDRHFDSVWRYAFALSRDEQTADEVTQDAFLTGWKRLPTLTRQADSAIPWLLVTAKNHYFNARRKESRRPDPAPLPEDFELPARQSDDPAVSLELKHFLSAAVEGLSDADRNLFDLVIVSDMSYDEAALALGLPNSTVRSRISRFRMKIKNHLVGKGWREE